LDDSQVVGVQSPVVCIKGGNGIMWSITSAGGVDHYPEYVSDSLFNTNPAFDFGAFVSLAEQVQKGYPVTSFYHTFEQPGVYTFRDAGDKTKETVIGVVDPIVDCPKAFESNPIQPLSADLLKSFPSSTEDQNQMITPNYELIMAICVGLGIVLLLMLIALYIRKTHGWGKASAARPKYRKLGEFEDFHQMASKKEQVRRVAQSGADGPSGVNLDDVDDLGAGYIDLEGFNVQMLFDKLQDQTHLMAEQLTQQKHDVREFYDKVTRETVTLRTLVDKHNQSGFSAELVRRAERRQREIDRELVRRKELGADALVKFEECLDLIEEDAKLRVEECALLDQAWNAINEAELTEASAEGVLDADMLRMVQEFIAKIHENIEARSVERSKFTLGLGAVLLDHSRKPVDRAKLFDRENRLKPVQGLIQVDDLTGLLVPALDTEMKYRERHYVSVPSHCCMHPISGRIVPIEGNVYIDVTQQELFVMNENIPSATLCDGPIPYIVNRMSDEGDCYPSSHAMYAHLIPEEEKGWPLNRDRDMLDPHTGLRVPVLAVTHDLRTREIVAVGGSMLDLETRLMKPIRIGDIMQDPESGDVLVIMGIKIDEQSGKVQPIGAKYVDEDTGQEFAMVFGAPITDEFSGAPRKVARCISDPLNPSRTLAIDDDCGRILQQVEDSSMLNALEILEQQVVMLQHQSSVIRSTASLGSSSLDPKISELVRKMEPMMRTSKRRREELQQIRVELDKVTLDRFVFVRDQRHRMYDLSETGGQKGALVDAITERELPILIGCFMYDENSKFDVQILDLELDEETGLYEPLGCTVVDPLSGRQVSATICGQMKDPFTDNIIPISGVRRDPGTYQVHAETNLRFKGSRPATLDAKLLSDLLKQLSTSSSVPGAIANLLTEHAPAPQVEPPPNAKKIVVRPPSLLSIPEDRRPDSGPSDDNFIKVKPLVEDTSDKHIAKLRQLADAHCGPGDDDMREPIQNLVTVAEQEYKDIGKGIDESRRKVMQEHLDKAREVMADDSLDPDEKDKLLDQLSKAEEFIQNLLDQEQARQITHFEKVQLDTVNRRMRKMKQKQARQKTLDELVESGDASTTDKAVHQLQAGMDDQLQERLQKLHAEYSFKTSEAIAQEQSRLLAALGQIDELQDEDADKLFAQYDKEVEKIEAKLRSEQQHKVAEIERTHDDLRSRRSAELRAMSLKLKAKTMWSTTQKKMGGVGMLLKAGTRKSLTEDHEQKSPAELKALAKERHEKEAERLAKALDNQTAAEKAMLQQTLQLEGSKEAALLQQNFLTMFQSTNDENERERLIRHHGKQMEELRKRQEVDKQRQQLEFEKKLKAKKERRLREHAQMAEKELSLLDDPKNFKEAEQVSKENELKVRLDVEQSRLENALQVQQASDISAANAQNKARSDAERLQAESAFGASILNVTDDEERARLLREHERKLAEIEARTGIAKGKADEDLQKRLEERRAKKLALIDAQRMQANAILIAAGAAATSTPASADELKRNAEQRHAELAQRLEGALDDMANGETKKLVHEVELKHHQEAAIMQQELLKNLESTSDEAERKRILDMHKVQMDELQKHQNADKQRQMQLLEKKLAARKERRLTVEHAEMAAKGIALLDDPSKLAEANKLSLEMEIKVQQEAESARLELEHEQEAAAAAAAMRSQQEFLLASEKKLHEETLQERLAETGTDQAAREKLLREHELKMAEIEARKALEKGKAHEDLQKKLEERRNKKKQMREQLEKQQVEAVANVTPERAEQGLGELTREAMLIIRQEEEAAQLALDLTEEAQGESTILAQELAERVEEERATEAERLHEQLSNDSLSSQEREAMIANHELKLKAIGAQLSMDAAKQQLSLEQQLAARRAKKLRKFEQDNAKEREEARIGMPRSESQAVMQTAASVEDDKRKLEEQFAKKQAEELEALRATMEMEKQKMLAEEKAKLEQAMQDATVQDIGNDERQKIIEQAESNMKKLEGYMDKEKMRQEDDLKTQLEERKRKKAERLKAQHERKEKQEALEKQKVEELAKFEQEQEAERKKEEERFKMEIEAEKERDIARMQQEIDAELERAQMEEKQKVEQLAQQVNTDAAAREAMLKEADQKIQVMQERASMEKARQEQLLQEKLAKKKAKKQAELQRKHDEQLQKKMLEEVVEIDTAMGETPASQDDEEEQEEAQHDVAAAQAAAEEFTKKLEAEKAKFEEEIKAALEAQEAHKRELLAKQEEERKRLEEEMRRDAEAFEEKIKAEQERKLQALEEKKKQMEEEMSKKAEHSTQEERQLLIDMHEKKLGQMEQVCGWLPCGC